MKKQTPLKNSKARYNIRLACFLSAFMLAVGCVKQNYSQAPLDVEQIYTDISKNHHLQTGVDEFLSRFRLDAEPAFSFDKIALTMLFQHPELDAAIGEVSVKQAEEIIAAQTFNPSIQTPLEYNERLDGSSPWVFGFILNFIYERKEKRVARESMALAATEFTRIKVEQKARQLLWDLYYAWFQYQSSLQIADILEQETGLRKEIVELLQRRQELGEASTFEVSSNRIAYQRSLLMLSQHNINVNDRLIKLQLIASDENIGPVNDAEYKWQDESYFNAVPVKPTLQQIALHQRYDVRLALQEYASYEARLKLEIEKQYPDIKLSPGFIFDQADSVWALGAQWLLPLFHKNQGQIEKAIRERALIQKRFIVLQNNIINSIETNWHIFERRKHAYDRAITLLEEMQVREADMQKQFELGYIDRVAYLRSKLETIEVSRDVKNMKMNVIEAYQNLQNTIQAPLLDNIRLSDVVVHLIELRLGA